MISLKRVSKNFGRLCALKDVSIELEVGKSYALIGPNSSGKTTLIKSILGMVLPTSGDILFEGESIINSWAYREKIGYMPQIGHYPENMSVGQIFDMMKNIRPHPSSLDEELMEAFSLNEIFNKRMHALSGGTRQKVSAALAFLFHVPVLILDEPTAGLDPISVEMLKEKIINEKQKGKLVIITSHILNDLDDLATDIVYLFEGKLHYNDTLEALKRETNETRLGKAIATLIKQKELLESVTK